MEISINFPGGNINVIESNGDIIKVCPQLRDTAGDWFYWAFQVLGASRRTLTFDFTPYKYIGYHGAAVSKDLKKWRWTGGNDNNLYSFTYTFGEDDDSVYFAHDMLYGTERFYNFAERLGLKIENLCTTDKGRNVPFVRFGDGEDVILLTARHHCCESTGNYMLEGVIEELFKSPLTNSSVIAVPFVDIDGVIDGDQGKNRIPHDHNRDYIENPLYKSVSGIKDIILNNKVRYAFDFHSPWHVGGRNDKVFFVRCRDEDMEKYIRLGKLFEQETNEKTMKYNSVDDLNPGVEWNNQQNGMKCSFASFCAEQPNMNLAFTIETAYFGGKDDVVNQDKLVMTGNAFARALKKYKA